MRSPLGPDKRVAKARLSTAVAEIQAKIAIAERRVQIATGEAITPGRYPLPVDQIALRNYNERLAFDAELRSVSQAWASVGIDDRMVAMFRDGFPGKLPDDAMETLVGAVAADPVADDVSASQFNGLTFEDVIQEKERMTGMGLRHGAM